MLCNFTMKQRKPVFDKLGRLLFDALHYNIVKTLRYPVSLVHCLLFVADVKARMTRTKQIGELKN